MSTEQLWCEDDSHTPMNRVVATCLFAATSGFQRTSKLCDACAAEYQRTAAEWADRYRVRSAAVVVRLRPEHYVWAGPETVTE